VSVGPESLSPTTLDEAFFVADATDLFELSAVFVATDEAEEDGLEVSAGLDEPPAPHPVEEIKLAHKAMDTRNL
jgi:hypothetical protein